MGLRSAGALLGAAQTEHPKRRAAAMHAFQGAARCWRRHRLRYASRRSRIGLTLEHRVSTLVNTFGGGGGLPPRGWGVHAWRVRRSLYYRAEDSVLAAVQVQGRVLLEWLQRALDEQPFYQAAQVQVGRNSKLRAECRVNLLEVPRPSTARRKKDAFVGAASLTLPAGRN